MTRAGRMLFLLLTNKGVPKLRISCNFLPLALLDSRQSFTEGLAPRNSIAEKVHRFTSRLDRRGNTWASFVTEHRLALLNERLHALLLVLCCEAGEERGFLRFQTLLQR